MRLNQILALEKGIKSKNYGEVTLLHKACQKPDLFNGFSKQYRRKEEEGEEYPPESKIVQFRAEDVIERASHLWSEAFDIEATKDYANMLAKADVEVDGVTVIKDAPVTFLLSMEKQVNDMRKFFETIPTLDSADNWTEDKNAGLYKTEPIPTHRTKKVPKVLTLFAPTKEFPGQAQVLTEDVVVGYWDTVKLSGALPAPRKREILERLDKLGNAIKVAREKANMSDAINQKVGAAIFGFLLA